MILNNDFTMSVDSKTGQTVNKLHASKDTRIPGVPVYRLHCRSIFFVQHVSFYRQSDEGTRVS